MVNSNLLGNLFIVAAPSGGGKTSLVKELIARLDNIEVSISHTTRPARPGEKEGIDYFFVSEAEFQAMIAASAFIEHATVFNHFYGTSVEQIKRRLAMGIDIVLDIDWQGAQQIKKLFPESISIFIVPPSLEILQTRLEVRRQDNHEIIAARMLQAKNELSHLVDFDYLVVNDNFAKAASEILTIVSSNRLVTKRQLRKIDDLLSLLLSK